MTAQPACPTNRGKLTDRFGDAEEVGVTGSRPLRRVVQKGVRFRSDDSALMIGSPP